MCSLKKSGKKGGHATPRAIFEGFQNAPCCLELFGERNVDRALNGDPDGWLMNCFTPLVDANMGRIHDRHQEIIQENTLNSGQEINIIFLGHI